MMMRQTKMVVKMMNTMTIAMMIAIEEFGDEEHGDGEEQVIILE
jgi:hypothetical protein